MTKFTIRTALLEAIERFAYPKNDSGRDHLATVRVTADDLVATNGHRIVIVPNDHEGGVEEPFLLPTTLIRAHVAAARSRWTEYEGEMFYGESGQTYAYTKGSFYRLDTDVTVFKDDRSRTRCTLSYGGIDTTETLKHEFSEYPKTADVEKGITREGSPTPGRFDPKMFEGFRQLVVAHGGGAISSVELVGWDKRGTGVGPTEWKTSSGVRLIFMGLARDGREAKAASEKIHGPGTNAAESPAP
jgi:hypothetical protein